MTEPPNKPSGDIEAWGLNRQQAVQYHRRLVELQYRQATALLARARRLDRALDHTVALLGWVVGLFGLWLLLGLIWR